MPIGNTSKNKTRSQVDLNSFQHLIDQNVIRVQKHPDADLFIYNYTEKCQYDGMWTEETMMCRGLIVDKEGYIIARPFKKFFNLEEYLAQEKELPAEPFEVYDKMDGSLGILYFDAFGQPKLATRGSFTSKQAMRGTEILQKKYSHIKFDSIRTYLFEIIYPENRIVVSYPDISDIFLLAIIDTQTGEEKPYDQMAKEYGDAVPLVERFDGITDLKTLKGKFRDNREGYVIHFCQSGLRLKLKYDEYVRIHRLVTGINAKRIWEHLKEKQSLNELLEKVPDEFYQWVNKTAAHLQGNYKGIEKEAYQIFQEAKNLPTRKDQAVFIKKTKYPQVIFPMLDNKDYSEMIWKIIKPQFEKPFREDEL